MGMCPWQRPPVRVTYETEMGKRGLMPAEQVRSRDRVRIDSDHSGIRKGTQGQLLGLDWQLGTAEVRATQIGAGANATSVVTLPLDIVTVLLHSADPRISPTPIMASAPGAASAPSPRGATYREDPVAGPIIAVAELADDRQAAAIAALLAREVPAGMLGDGPTGPMPTILRWASRRTDPERRLAEEVDALEVRATAQWLSGLVTRVEDSNTRRVIAQIWTALDRWLAAEGRES